MFLVCLLAYDYQLFSKFARYSLIYQTYIIIYYIDCMLICEDLEEGGELTREPAVAGRTGDGCFGDAGAKTFTGKESGSGSGDREMMRSR